MKQVKIILITGATGAIGSALARHYAQTGITLILQGRNTEALNQLARVCQTQGAEVIRVVLDLRHITVIRQWIAELTPQYLPDLVIANAGMNTHAVAKGLGENWHDVDALLDVNIKSTIALVNAISPAMQQRGSGQIALMSSLAAYHGLPVTPSYCASKAAIKAYGEGLRGALARFGVGVTVIMPGYVQSPLCQAMPGPKLFLWTAEKAARVIAQRLSHNPARISFPFPLNAGTWLLAVMPSALAQYFLALLGYGR